MKYKRVERIGVVVYYEDIASSLFRYKLIEFCDQLKACIICEISYIYIHAGGATSAQFFSFKLEQAAMMNRVVFYSVHPSVEAEALKDFCKERKITFYEDAVSWNKPANGCDSINGYSERGAHYV